MAVNGGRRESGTEGKKWGLVEVKKLEKTEKLQGEGSTGGKVADRRMRQIGVKDGKGRQKGTKKRSKTLSAVIGKNRE